MTCPRPPVSPHGTMIFAITPPCHTFTGGNVRLRCLSPIRAKEFTQKGDAALRRVVLVLGVALLTLYALFHARPCLDGCEQPATNFHSSSLYRGESCRCDAMLIALRLGRKMLAMLFAVNLTCL